VVLYGVLAALVGVGLPLIIRWLFRKYEYFSYLRLKREALIRELTDFCRDIPNISTIESSKELSEAVQRKADETISLEDPLGDPLRRILRNLSKRELSYIVEGGEE